MSHLAVVLAATEASTGTSGALVVLGLILASVALFYFMNRSLRRVPPSFGPTDAEPPSGTEGMPGTHEGEPREAPPGG